MRKIIHVDLDAFFASVEQLDNPDLKGKAVIVGGTPTGRGVVATASYEARKFGIRSAMPAAKAYRLCPHGIFLPPRFERYKEISKQIRQIFLEFTDLVEPLSLDEAFLDVTQNPLGEASAGKIAKEIKNQIFARTGLTASAGVSSLKFVAKVASDLKKPDGLVIVPPEKIQSFIDSLPIDKFWGVGPKTAEKLKMMGVHSGLELRNCPPDYLEKKLGKQGIFLKNLSNGIDNRKVSPSRKIKSSGAERTFTSDITRYEDLENHLFSLCERMTQSLQKNKKRGRTISLKIRFSDFRTITRSETFPFHTDKNEIIYRSARKNLRDIFDKNNEPIRLLGISISNFLPDEQWEQLSFEQYSENFRVL